MVTDWHSLFFFGQTKTSYLIEYINFEEGVKHKLLTQSQFMGFIFALILIDCLFY